MSNDVDDNDGLLQYWAV